MANSNLKLVGTYKKQYNFLLNANLPCSEIFQSDGLYKHIIKRHPECLKYINSIPDIIENPDYLGINPKEKNSIEFVKCYNENVLVAVKLDIDNNYFYVASLYDIKETKLQRRLNSNRLVKFTLDNST